MNKSDLMRISSRRVAIRLPHIHNNNNNDNKSNDDNDDNNSNNNNENDNNNNNNNNNNNEICASPLRLATLEQLATGTKHQLFTSKLIFIHPSLKTMHDCDIGYNLVPKHVWHCDNVWPCCRRKIFPVCSIYLFF